MKTNIKDNKNLTNIYRLITESGEATAISPGGSTTSNLFGSDGTETPAENYWNIIAGKLNELKSRGVNTESIRDIAQQLSVYFKENQQKAAPPAAREDGPAPVDVPAPEAAPEAAPAAPPTTHWSPGDAMKMQRELIAQGRDQQNNRFNDMMELRRMQMQNDQSYRDKKLNADKAYRRGELEYRQNQLDRRYPQSNAATPVIDPLEPNATAPIDATTTATTTAPANPNIWGTLGQIGRDALTAGARNVGSALSSGAANVADSAAQGLSNRVFSDFAGSSGRRPQRRYTPQPRVYGPNSGYGN